jgi:hypothetical protein
MEVVGAGTSGFSLVEFIYSIFFAAYMRSWHIPLIATLATIGVTASMYFMARSLLGGIVSVDADVDWKLQRMLHVTQSEWESMSRQYTETGEYITEDFSHILTLPDVHGDGENMVLALWSGMLLTMGENESPPVNLEEFKQLFHEGSLDGSYPASPLFPASRVVLVSMGDLVDRGPDSLLCLRLLWSIDRILGWKVVSLYGNHEIMAVTGNLDYVHWEESAKFGSDDNRKSAFNRTSSVWNRFITTSVLAARFVDKSTKKGVVFAHAGIESYWIRKMGMGGFGDSFTEWNKLAYQTAQSDMTGGLEKLSKEAKFVFLNYNSPIWSRLFGGEPDSMVPDEKFSTVCDIEMPTVLNLMKVNRVVVGHTPQRSKRLNINQDCQNSLFRIDVALSKYMVSNSIGRYPGRPTLLVMKVSKGATDFDRITGVYYNEKRGIEKEEFL